MRRLVLVLVLAHGCEPAFATPDTTTPIYCAALLTGPPPETLERARQILDCERMTAAAQLDACADGLRQAQAALVSTPVPPSRVLWLTLGAAAVAAVWAGYEAAQ